MITHHKLQIYFTCITWREPIVNKQEERPKQFWATLGTARSFCMPPRSTNNAANFRWAAKAQINFITSGKREVAFDASSNLELRCNRARQTSTPFSCSTGPRTSTYSPKVSRHWIQYLSLNCASSSTLGIKYSSTSSFTSVSAALLFFGSALVLVESLWTTY